jgi:hypothetical protein
VSVEKEEVVESDAVVDDDDVLVFLNFGKFAGKITCEILPSKISLSLLGLS